MAPIDQFKILRETLDHVTVMYDNAMVRAENAEAELLGKVERLERELAKVSNAKELNRINDSYEHEMRTFSKRPSSNDRYNLVEER